VYMQALVILISLFIRNQMRPELEALERFTDEIGDAGKQLFQLCDGSMFPCDTLALTVFDRSLNLVKAFRLVVDEGIYTCGAALLRLQLDSLLRFNGVMHCRDPHAVADEVLTGKQLRKIKGKNGQVMTDRNLVTLLSERNPWVPKIYEMACGYVHLSEQHFQHFYMRSIPVSEGVREFRISDEDSYLPDAYKLDLINAFDVVTRATIEVVRIWSEVREDSGTAEELRVRFTRVM
jgi:hypothetical protein